MSNYIVLVKQVPDVTQITDNAFDPDTGTLVRGRLISVINELDTQALAFANHMVNESGDKDSQIVSLTMGPPMAESVLRYSLSRCADKAVLLTDRALGGADTWATANPLAFAIRRIVKDVFNSGEDYYVVCGMQSVDGDTAQVPPQIAEELSVPCIAYATDARYKEGRFEFTRIVSGGSQVVSVDKPPAVLTVAKYEYPLFAKFSRSRWASSQKLITWSNEEVKATQIGVKGSKTRVIRVFPPGKSSRKCQQVGDAKSLGNLIYSTIKNSSGGGQKEKQEIPYILPDRRADKFDRSFEGTAKERDDFRILADILRKLKITQIEQIDDTAKEKILSLAGKHFHKKALDDMINGLSLSKSTFSGQVWVVAEHNQLEMHPATYELIGKARELANSLETKVGVVLPGCKVGSLAEDLIASGADDVYVLDHELLKEFDPATYRKAITDCIRKYWPQIVLFAATAQGRMLAPMISYRVGCGLTADCTSLDIRDSSRKGHIGILLQTRPALGGNVMATICTKDSRVQMATARPGVMKRLDHNEKRKGDVINEKAELSQNDRSLKIIKTELGTGEVNFDTEIIVSGGKGMQSRDNYERLVGSLCDCLGKKLEMQVARGASRAAVEQGFVDRLYQVGQTGTSVGPKLYVALGISGAIQHMIGVANTETIVAINSDPNAPIFKQCDYYIVGTVEEVIPQLVQALERQ